MHSASHRRNEDSLPCNTTNDNIRGGFRGSAEGRQPPPFQTGGGSPQHGLSTCTVAMRPFVHRRSIRLPLLNILDPPLDNTHIYEILGIAVDNYYVMHHLVLMASHNVQLTSFWGDLSMSMRHWNTSGNNNSFNNNNNNLCMFIRHTRQRNIKCSYNNVII